MWIATREDCGALGAIWREISGLKSHVTSFCRESLGRTSRILMVSALRLYDREKGASECHSIIVETSAHGQGCGSHRAGTVECDL